jgi:hypothetical protein
MFKNKVLMEIKMKKTLLSLLAVGSISCAVNPRPVTYDVDPLTVNEVYQPTEQEEPVLSRLYDDENSSQTCLRSHYVEMQANAMKSFLATEHCLSLPEARDGVFYAVRFVDTDENGLADQLCTAFATTTVGRVETDSTTCREMAEISLVEIMDKVLYDSANTAALPTYLFQLANSIQDYYQ